MVLCDMYRSCIRINWLLMIFFHTLLLIKQFNTLINNGNIFWHECCYVLLKETFTHIKGGQDQFRRQQFLILTTAILNIN